MASAGRTAQRTRARTEPRQIDRALASFKHSWATRSSTYQTCVGGAAGAIWVAFVAFYHDELHGLASAIGRGEPFGVVIVVVALLPAIALVGLIIPSLDEGYPALLGVLLLMAFTLGLEVRSAESAGDSAPPAAEEPAPHETATASSYVADDEPIEEPEACRAMPVGNLDVTGRWLCHSPIAVATVYEFSSRRKMNSRFRRAKGFVRVQWQGRWSDSAANSGSAGWWADVVFEGTPAVLLTDRAHRALVIGESLGGEREQLEAWLEELPWREVFLGY